MSVATIDAFHRDTKRLLGLLPAPLPRAGRQAAEPRPRGPGRARAARAAGRGDHPEHRPPAPQGGLRAGDRGARLDRHRELHELRRQLRARAGGVAVRRRTAIATCTCCAGKVKPDVVLFGELLPEEAMEEARASCAPAPTCCSASAPRSRSIRSPACRSSPSSSGGRLAIVTKSSTPYDSEAAVRLDGDVAEALSAVLAALG